LQAFTLGKSLMLGLSYPYDWGFIPSTKGEDGDPIDVLVLHDAATSPGLVLKCRIIGVLEVLQKEDGKQKIRNDRLLAVPRDSNREKSDSDARSLPKQVREEIEKFFVATDELEDKQLKFLGWKGPKKGKRLVNQAAKQFKKA
jgi:inorganic pyrophosphatase